jgi:hypothetical protein
MRQFIARYHDKIRGVLSGFDRVLFRGHLTSLWYEKGLRHFLAAQGVLLKHFGPFVQAVTQMLRQASVEVAEKAGVPVIYLESSKTRKEDVIRRLLKERPIDRGLIAILSCVEPCVSWQIERKSGVGSRESGARSRNRPMNATIRPTRRRKSSRAAQIHVGKGPMSRSHTSNVVVLLRLSCSRLPTPDSRLPTFL